MKAEYKLAEKTFEVEYNKRADSLEELVQSIKVDKYLSTLIFHIFSNLLNFKYNMPFFIKKDFLSYEELVDIFLETTIANSLLIDETDKNTLKKFLDCFKEYIKLSILLHCSTKLDINISDFKNYPLDVVKEVLETDCREKDIVPTKKLMQIKRRFRDVYKRANEIFSQKDSNSLSFLLSCYKNTDFISILTLFAFIKEKNIALSEDIFDPSIVKLADNNHLTSLYVLFYKNDNLYLYNNKIACGYNFLDVINKNNTLVNLLEQLSTHTKAIAGQIFDNIKNKIDSYFITQLDFPFAKKLYIDKIFPHLVALKTFDNSTKNKTAFKMYWYIQGQIFLVKQACQDNPLDTIYNITEELGGKIKCLDCEDYKNCYSWHKYILDYSTIHSQKTSLGNIMLTTYKHPKKRIMLISVNDFSFSNEIPIWYEFLTMHKVCSEYLNDAVLFNQQIVLADKILQKLEQNQTTSICLSYILNSVFLKNINNLVDVEKTLASDMKNHIENIKKFTQDTRIFKNIKESIVLMLLLFVFAVKYLLGKTGNIPKIASSYAILYNITEFNLSKYKKIWEKRHRNRCEQLNRFFSPIMIPKYSTDNNACNAKICTEFFKNLFESYSKKVRYGKNDKFYALISEIKEKIAKKVDDKALINLIQIKINASNEVKFSENDYRFIAKKLKEIIKLYAPKKGINETILLHLIDVALHGLTNLKLSKEELVLEKLLSVKNREYLEVIFTDYINVLY